MLIALDMMDAFNLTEFARIRPFVLFIALLTSAMKSSACPIRVNFFLGREKKPGFR